MILKSWMIGVAATLLLTGSAFAQAAQAIAPGVAPKFDFVGNPNTWTLSGRGTDVASYGVPYFRSAITNTNTAFDIMPNGTSVDSGSGLAWADICNSDLSPINSNNFQCLVFEAKAASFIIGSHKGGTGTDLPVGIFGSQFYVCSSLTCGTKYFLVDNTGTYVAPTGPDRVFWDDTTQKMGSGVCFMWSSTTTGNGGGYDANISRLSAGHIGIGGGVCGNLGNTGWQSGVGQIGSGTALTLTAGEMGFNKIAATGAAPGASGGKIELVCGTNAGSAKLIAYAGTSTTPVTVLDNIGSGVTGC